MGASGATDGTAGIAAADIPCNETDDPWSRFDQTIEPTQPIEPTQTIEPTQSKIGSWSRERFSS
ncbi:hypothetical protein GCM10027280_56060 [Micromonospora polyrhachis]